MPSSFRNYDKASEAVRNCYQLQRRYQTVAFVDKMIEKYCKFNRQNSFWELFDILTEFVDLSDPDINLTNHQHLFQTAEKIREDGHPEWFQLVGLIHDLGKIIYKKNGCVEDGTSMETQWGIVGDTFLVGITIPESVVFPEFNTLNLDQETLGYDSKCGLSEMKCSFGHDEYLYRLLKHNKIALPEQAYYIIRYHSLYLWHSSGEYQQYESGVDREMKTWVQKFQKYDLYTKNPSPVDELEARTYYKNLVNKYFPNKLWW